jgi:hypothetical protein
MHRRVVLALFRLQLIKALALNMVRILLSHVVIAIRLAGGYRVVFMRRKHSSRKFFKPTMRPKATRVFLVAIGYLGGMSSQEFMLVLVFGRSMSWTDCRER